MMTRWGLLRNGLIIYFSGFFTIPSVAIEIAAQAAFEPSVF
jgi:hypothetical protein